MGLLLVHFMPINSYIHTADRNPHFDLELMRYPRFYGHYSMHRSMTGYE